MQVQIKRIYDPPASSDGLRVLVDRLWPRGLTKADAKVDVWAKELAPSNDLRKWFSHEDEKFEEFARRYQLELDSSTVDVEKLLDSGDRGVVTLLYAAKSTTINHAVVLQSWLLRGLA